VGSRFACADDPEDITSLGQCDVCSRTNFAWCSRRITNAPAETTDVEPLAWVEKTLTDILTLTEGLEEPDLRRSRLTRETVQRMVSEVSATLHGVGPDARSALPELDWDAWALTAERLARGGDVGAGALWFAVHTLAPATLTWLRVHRRGDV
jgi:hypothetical protein